VRTEDEARQVGFFRRHLGRGAVVIALAILAAALLAACGGGSSSSSSSTTAPETEEEAKPTTASASEPPKITPALLKSSSSLTGAQLEEGAGTNWPLMGGDLGNERFSTLSQINTENASKLHLVWQHAYSPELGEKSGTLEEESQPVVSEGVMYIATPEANVLAINAVNGEKIWEWKANETKDELAEKTLYSSGPQGVSIGGGQVLVETNVGNVVAINAQTGKEVWQKLVRLGNTKLESPATPIAYEGVVYVGVSGGEVARGHVDAYDEKTGNLLWRTYLACGPTETPSGAGNCPKADFKGEKLNEGGANVWTYPAFDPKDGLLFVTTSNPSTTEGTKGDFKWSASVVALEIKTGHIKWGYQMTHHDIWDYDYTTAPVYFEREVNGKMEGVVGVTSKTDLHFQFDAATGKPTIPTPEEPVPTSAKGKTPDVAAQKQLDLSETQPIPAGTEQSEVIPHCASEELLPNPAPDGTKYVYSCLYAAPGSGHFTAYAPSLSGGQDGKTPLSYDPETGDMYYCEAVSAYAKKIGAQEAGGNPFQVNVGWQGSAAAVSMENNHMVWQNKLMAPQGPCRSGSTTTAGGLLFTSALHGELFAEDAKTGKQLWSFKGPEYVFAAPIVYEAAGKEYVAIYYGGEAPFVDGMTETHQPRLLVFSVEAEPEGTASELPESELSSVESEVLALAAQGKEETAEEAEGGGKEAEAEEGEEKTTASPGSEVFSANCATCHTLAAAGATGTTGPNLDELKPTEKAVETQVINGGGAMPAFGKSHILTEEEIHQVSVYVAGVAGKNVTGH
jgi:quinohemoprotein ethanol dehydrogenase